MALWPLSLLAVLVCTQTCLCDRLSTETLSSRRAVRALQALTAANTTAKASQSCDAVAALPHSEDACAYVHRNCEEGAVNRGRSPSCC
jgi:hypothetical protein